MRCPPGRAVLLDTGHASGVLWLVLVMPLPGRSSPTLHPGVRAATKSTIYRPRRAKEVGAGLFLATAARYSKPMPKSQFAGSMTLQQFAQAVKKAKASPMAIARAQRVLVDGERVQDVADSDGVATRQIYKAIHKAYSSRDGTDR